MEMELHPADLVELILNIFYKVFYTLFDKRGRNSKIVSI